MKEGRLTVRFEIGDQPVVTVEFFTRDVAANAESIRQKGHRLIDIIAAKVDPVGLGVFGMEGKVKKNPPEFARFQDG